MTSQRTSTPSTVEFPPPDRCLCNGVHIRSGAKILALLDQITAIIVLAAVIWEYVELKRVKPVHHSTPILDSIFALSILACLGVAASASALLLDATSATNRRGRRGRGELGWLIKIYVIRRSISAICLPTGILISVIGLVFGDQETDQSPLRRAAAHLAQELFDETEFGLNQRAYIDAVLGGLLTACVLSCPFDLWACMITYRYYRYSQAKERCRRNLSTHAISNTTSNEAKEDACELRVKPSPVRTSETALTDCISEADFGDALDVSLLMK